MRFSADNVHINGHTIEIMSTKVRGSLFFFLFEIWRIYNTLDSKD